MQFDNEKGEAEAAEEEEKRINWYDFWKHKAFWTRYVPTGLTVALFIVGICLFIWQRGFRVAYFGVGSSPLLLVPALQGTQAFLPLNSALMSFLSQEESTRYLA